MSQDGTAVQIVIEKELSALGARLRAARQSLARGSIVDLTPIEEEVRWLCSEVEALPKEERRELRPRLMGLLEEVTYLGENLRAGVDELKQLLGAASDRRKALSAYASQKANKS